MALLLLYSFVHEAKQRIFTHLKRGRSQLLFSRQSNADAEAWEERNERRKEARKRLIEVCGHLEFLPETLLNTLLNRVYWGNSNAHIERDFVFQLILEINVNVAT